jgi:hypothetical protein
MMRIAGIGRWAWPGVLLTVLAVAASSSSAQAPTRELLNSERIEQAFGNYGIGVLQSGGGVRVSKLYSVHEGVEVCRTFAVVLYPASVDSALSEEHALIAAGQSIGATFASRGWSVVKTHRYFGTLVSTPGLQALMGQIAVSDLAVHIYVLSVARAGEEHEYVTIAEVHHPAYLQLADLHELYGNGMDLPTARDAQIQKTLDLVLARMP